jgi:hypothetical protein
VFRVTGSRALLNVPAIIDIDMGSKLTPNYPLVPRSTAALLSGHFWALPLSDGSFGCGRVVDLTPPGAVGARVWFLAAVLDWHSEVPPTHESIAGVGCLDQGRAHLKAITETGGSILGYRSLELDKVEPWEFRGSGVWVNSQVYKGLRPIRPQRPDDEGLPVLSTWGFRVPILIATKRFTRARE